MIPAHKPLGFRQDSGFTLLELLVAITLVAMMAVGIYAVLSISVRSWVRGNEAIDTNQRHRSTLDLSRKQIASAYPLYAPVSTEQETVPTLIFTGTDNGLRFISLNSLQSFESPGLTLVSYEIGQDSAGHSSLVEKEVHYTGQEPDESALSGSRSVPIFSNLSSCTFEYFDPGESADKPSQWVSEWDGSILERLPAAVRLTMVSQEQSGSSALSRQLIIPIHARANSVTGAIPVNPFGARNAGRTPGTGGLFPVDRD